MERGIGRGTRHIVAALAVVAGALGAGPGPARAEEPRAAQASRQLTLRVADTTVSTTSRVRLSGEAATLPVGSTVRLEWRRDYADAWETAAFTTLNSRHRYAFAPRPHEGWNLYRAVAPRRAGVGPFRSATRWVGGHRPPQTVATSYAGSPIRVGPGQDVTLTFTGSAGDLVSVGEDGLLKHDGAVVSPLLQRFPVRARSGVLWRLPADGAYSLRLDVLDYARRPAHVQVSLTVEGGLLPGQPTQFEATRHGQFVRYPLTLPVGGGVTVSSTTSDHSQAYGVVLDQAGASVVATADLGLVQLFAGTTPFRWTPFPYTPPGPVTPAGDYQLLLRGEPGLTLTSTLTDTVVIDAAPGETIDATAPAGQEAVVRFAGLAGDVVALETASGISGRLLYGPDGQPLTGMPLEVSYAQPLAPEIFVLPADGDYLLRQQATGGGTHLIGDAVEAPDLTITGTPSSLGVPDGDRVVFARITPAQPDGKLGWTSGTLAAGWKAYVGDPSRPLVLCARPPLCPQSLPYLDQTHWVLTQPTGMPYAAPYSVLVLVPHGATGSVNLVTIP